MTMPIPNIICEKLSPEEVEDFMNRHGYDEWAFAEFLGVTVQAVRLWLNGKRDFSVLNSRLLRLFDKKPELMLEYFNG